MDFKSGDKVMLRGPSRMCMTVKSVSAVGVLCEWSDAILRGELTVSPESLEQMTMPAPSPATAEGPPRGLRLIATENRLVVRQPRLDQKVCQEPPFQYPLPSCSRHACFSPSFHFQSFGWTVRPNVG